MGGWVRPLGWTMIGLVIFGLLHPSPLRAQDEGERARGRNSGVVLARSDDYGQVEAGRRVYLVACATCHGIKGDGRGPGAAGFEFAPTNFVEGVYKLRSTRPDSPPTDDDIIRSIGEGVPGTEMVPFGRILSRKSIAAAVAYLKTLSPVFSDAKFRLKPGDILRLPETRPAPPSPGSVAAGRELFQREECASCHGDTGDGRGPDAEGMTDDSDRPLRMLDFRKDVFKSGYTDRDLYRSITSGMDGTPMEAYFDSTTEAERWQMVDFMRSLAGGEGGFFRYLFNDNPSGFDYGQ